MSKNRLPCCVVLGFSGCLWHCHLDHFCKNNLGPMTCCLPPEQILFSSASLIGTDKCKLMLFYIPHMTAYSLAAALLMCSWLLSGRRTTDRSSSTHPQLMPATVSLCRAIGLFNLRARSSYERRPVTCPGNWSTRLIPVNYVSFLGPKEIAEYDVFFLTAAGTFVSGCWHLPPTPSTLNVPLFLALSLAHHDW